jgi:hypothetical protein
MHGTDVNCIYNFKLNTWREKTTGRHTHIWEDNIKIGFKYDMRMWMECILPRTVTSGGVLWTR